MYNQKFTIFALALLVAGLVNYAEAMSNVPFDYDSKGIEITNFEMDFKGTELILDVDVTQPKGNIEIVLEREFFDSVYQGQDEDFTILADGEMVYYKEIENTPTTRIINFNLISGTDQVEIFGSHLMGMPIEKSEPSPPAIPTATINKLGQLSMENKKLSQENEKLVDEKKMLEEQNEVLIEENQELDSRIFELENLVASLEIQVSNLNALVVEQVNVIYNWVLSPTFS